MSHFSNWMLSLPSDYAVSDYSTNCARPLKKLTAWRMRRLAGLCGTTLIHHSLTDCIPLKAQHANTISSTAGHLTSTSLTRLHANSITANAAPLTNTSVIGLEILRLYRNTGNCAVSRRQSPALFCLCYFCCSVANTLICLRRCRMPLKESCFDSVSLCPQQIWVYGWICMPLWREPFKSDYDFIFHKDSTPLGWFLIRTRISKKNGAWRQ